MPRFKLTIAYVGTRYSGWQIQEKATPPPTIQGELEKVVCQVTGQPVRIHGAGRTDSGVHAEGQVAHMDIPEAKARLPWQRIFNTALPRDISVIGFEPVPATFHARFDVVQKTYTYHFWQERAYMPPHLRPFVWDCGLLNVSSMQAALPYLLGRRDFRALQNAGTPMENTVRTIFSMSIGSEYALSAHPAALVMRITADGFLKQMVRNIAGLLWAVGKGKSAPDAIPALLQQGQRAQAPACAPACGLHLTQVTYA